MMMDASTSSNDMNYSTRHEHELKLHI